MFLELTNHGTLYRVSVDTLLLWPIIWPVLFDDDDDKKCPYTILDVKHSAYTFKLLWSILPFLLAALDSHLPLCSSAHPEQVNWSVTEFRQSSPLWARAEIIINFNFQEEGSSQTGGSLKTGKRQVFFPNPASYWKRMKSSHVQKSNQGSRP